MSTFTTRKALMSQARTVLIVEDDPFIGADLQSCLEDLGCKTIGPVATAEAALDLIRSERPDFATLDVQLLDGESFEVAKELDRQNVGYAFVTARPDMVCKAGFTSCRTVEKPFSRTDIVNLIQDC